MNLDVDLRFLQGTCDELNQMSREVLASSCEVEDIGRGLRAQEGVFDREATLLSELADRIRDDTICLYRLEEGLATVRDAYDRTEDQCGSLFDHSTICYLLSVDFMFYDMREWKVRLMGIIGRNKRWQR